MRNFFEPPDRPLPLRLEVCRTQYRGGNQKRHKSEK
jgi:hypothetical protein